MCNIDKKPYSPKVVSIFSGCGGLDLGFHLEGYDTIWANDFAEWAVKSFERNFGKVIQYKDITKIDPYIDKSIPECDIVLGGFPCQDFSIIWKQPGLNGTRGGLFRHFAEFVDAKKPKAFVAENVKGLITANKGKAIETIIKDFESIAPGYIVKPHLYNFAEYGVPQFRERILFVGIRIDTGFDFIHPLPTHGPEGKHPYVTAGDALIGARDVPYNNELINIKEKTRKMLEMIPEGGNFRDIPEDTINKNLEEIKKTTTSSVYMEVTGTPQSILLQAVEIHCFNFKYYENQSNSAPSSYLQYSAASYSLGLESIGTVKSSTGIPSVDAKSFIRSSFGVRTSFSYWAIRTSAQLSGKPTAMPSSFWVR